MLPLRELKQKVLVIWVKNLLNSFTFLSYTTPAFSAEK